MEKDELQDIYRNSDVVIIPSVYESFGLVAIEALAAGCGVVAFSGSGIEESVCSCVNADFSGVGEVEDFSQRTVNLATKIFTDTTLRNESRRYVEEKFSLTEVSEAFLHFLKTPTV